ncbi:hypothetical protein H0H93_011018, partial [Arthromyces matolae]
PMPLQSTPHRQAYQINPPAGTQANNLPQWHPVSHNDSPLQTQDVVLPDDGPPMSLSPENGPHPPMQMTDPDNYLGEELTQALSQHLGFPAAQLVEKSVQVQVDPQTQTIKIDVDVPTPTLEASYRPCFEYLNDSYRDATMVVATVGQEHASSLLSLVRLRKMLERLAADDTNRRCKHLEVYLPDMGSTSDHLTEAYPGLLPLTTTFDDLQTLHWKSFRNQLHLMKPDTLNHLISLTLESNISVQDTVYLLRCVSGTVHQCSIKSVDNGDIHALPQSNFNDVTFLQLKSLTIRAKCSLNSLLNSLKFDRRKFKKLHLEVHNDLVDPQNMETIPWAVMNDIKLTCNFVSGGAEWVRRNGGQAGRLTLQTPTASGI